MKNILFLDAETYSETDLTKTSVFRYVEDPTFEIQLLSYSFNGGNVITVDLAQGEKIPNEVIKAIYDKETLKVAHNANFERIVLSRFLGMKTGVYLPCDGWYCTMVHALTLGLPASLANLSVVLKLKNAKMNEGKDLIRFFAKPVAPTKKNDYRTRNYPHHDINKWNLYKEYNKYDVLAEIEVYNKLSLFPMNPDTYKEWILDSKVNDRGIMVPSTGDVFTKDLYATYISYVPLEELVVDLQEHRDNRGVFCELVRTKEAGQVSISTTNPEIVRGGHYHNTKMERFIVIKGKAKIEFEHVIDHNKFEFEVSGDKLQYVTIPVGYQHSINNIGDDELVLILWANELFDPNIPDSYVMEV